MAESVVLNEWSAEHVRVGDVLDALDELRRTEQLSATRAAVMTLVLLARDPAEAERAVSAIHLLGGHHPARTVVLVDHRTSGRDGVDATVRLVGSQAAGLPIWAEDVQLVVSGPVASHLDSLIEPLTLPDLPVVVWFVDGLPAPHDPLLAAADVMLVDARDFGDTDCFATLDSLVRTRPVVDLSWTRLRPWRRLLAVLFDGAFRPFVHGVRRAEVSGKTGPRHLLAGWLVDRLGLPSSALHLAEAEHVAMRLSAEADGRKGVFEVRRSGDDRMLVATASVEGGATASSVVNLPEANPAWGLADALSRLDHDVVYEHALRAALAL